MFCRDQFWGLVSSVSISMIYKTLHTLNPNQVSSQTTPVTGTNCNRSDFKTVLRTVKTADTTHLTWMVIQYTTAQGTQHNTRYSTKFSTNIFNWINQPDAAKSQVYYLSFKYSSTCFGRHHAHHQELQQQQ